MPPSGPGVTVSHPFWPWLLSVEDGVQRKALQQVQSVTTCAFQDQKNEESGSGGDAVA